MSDVGLDSSVLLAVLLNEIALEPITPVLEGAVISTVNPSEVLAKLIDLGLSRHKQTDQLLSLLDRVEPFTLLQAGSAGRLRSTTRQFGLSLGDRACLALAMELDADVYAADRAWAGLTLPCRIHLVR